MLARRPKSCRCSTTFLSGNRFRFRLCVLRMLTPAHYVKCERGVRCKINFFPARSMRRLLLCILTNTQNKRIIKVNYNINESRIVSADTVFKLISVVQTLPYRPVQMWGKRIFSFDLYSTRHVFQHYWGCFLKIRDVRSLEREIQNGRYCPVFIYNFESSQTWYQFRLKLTFPTPLTYPSYDSTQYCMRNPRWPSTAEIWLSITSDEEILKRRLLAAYAIESSKLNGTPSTLRQDVLHLLPLTMRISQTSHHCLGQRFPRHSYYVLPGGADCPEQWTLNVEYRPLKINLLRVGQAALPTGSNSFQTRPSLHHNLRR